MLSPLCIHALDLIVQVGLQTGVLTQSITGETIRQALLRLGIAWKRAKRWITSPDPDYDRKKRHEITC